MAWLKEGVSVTHQSSLTLHHVCLGWWGDTEISKQPIRTRYLDHVTGYQPIKDRYFLIRSVTEEEAGGGVEGEEGGGAGEDLWNSRRKGGGSVIDINNNQSELVI
eukprot:sb/3477938/